MQNSTCVPAKERKRAPFKHYPVGGIRKRHDGYLDVKMEDGSWIPLSHINWKNAYGEYPPKGVLLTYKDGNKQNCDVSNLEPITYQELLDRNSLNRMPKELQDVIHKQRIIKQMIKRRENGA